MNYECDKKIVGDEDITYHNWNMREHGKCWCGRWWKRFKQEPEHCECDRCPKCGKLI